jgi:hypothetical protein
LAIDRRLIAEGASGAVLARDRAASAPGPPPGRTPPARFGPNGRRADNVLLKPILSNGICIATLNLTVSIPSVARHKFLGKIVFYSHNDMQLFMRGKILNGGSNDRTLNSPLRESVVEIMQSFLIQLKAEKQKFITEIELFSDKINPKDKAKILARLRR